jgi:hypothetical protein
MHPGKSLRFTYRAATMNHRPISFPHWKAALADASFSPWLKVAFTREILSFLRHCKAARAAATVEAAKQ